jgi:hypothetical protein
MKRTNLLAAFFLASAMLSGGALLAQEHPSEHPKEKPKAGPKAEIHGGEVVKTKAHHFEVVWMANNVMVYLYDMKQKPLAAKFFCGCSPSCTMALSECPCSKQGGGLEEMHFISNLLNAGEDEAQVVQKVREKYGRLRPFIDK